MGVLVEVVIGLILTYLLVSLIVTVINEIIASVLKLRARGLRRGIESILDDENLRQAFLETRVYRMAGHASGARGPSYIPSGTFVSALLEAVDPKTSAGMKRSVGDLVAAIDQLAESDVKNLLSELVREVGDDIEEVQKAIADWFDEMMDRLNGVYKRNMQMLSLVFAALLCVALNVDSIQIGQALWYDDTLRQSIVGSAGELAADTGDIADLADIAVISEELRPLPIGWDFSGPGWSGDWFRSFQGWIFKILGIAFSTLAVSLGAPFWFDLLTKFVNIRGAGKAPQAGVERPSRTVSDGPAG